MRKMIEYIFELLLGSSSWFNCTKCSYSEDFQNQIPLSSKYCCCIKELVFPTQEHLKSENFLRLWFNHSKKVNLFYLLSINSFTSDFKTFKGLVSYGLF
jgi:hypothetical protein